MILGIESSCDDSSIALINSKNLKLEFYEKITQESEHSRFGGVVPELAARLHTAAIPELIAKLKPHFNDIKAIAVTNEPGLSVSLISGVSAAKALSIALNVPLIAVNHLIGHIFSLFLDKEIILPLGVLLVSGGHTMVLEIDEKRQIKILAQSMDDSFGESFDKASKMLGFSYPGGVIIENLAKDGADNRFNFTVPIKNKNRIEYSFSGLKNQLRMQISQMGELENLNKQDISDLAKVFQETAVSHIMDKLKIIFAKKKFKDFGVVGGASANLLLRENLSNLCKKYNTNLHLAPLKFCSDNAAFIARAGLEKYRNSKFCDFKELKISPRSELNGKFLDL